MASKGLNIQEFAHLSDEAERLRKELNAVASDADRARLQMALALFDGVLAQAKQQQEDIETLLTQAPFAIGIHRGRELRYEFANPAATALVGQRPLLGKTPEEAFPELPREAFDDLRRAFEQGEAKTARQPARLLRADGQSEERVYHSLIIPLRGAAGHVARVMSVAADVTDQVLAQKKVEESQRRATLIAEAIPQIVWVLRVDGSLEYVNRRWTDYSGLTLEQTQNAGWVRAAHPDDVEPVNQAWQKCLSTGKGLQVQARYRRASDGTYRWHLVLAVPVRNENGTVVEWFGTSTDIEDQKRSEDVAKFLAEASTVLGASLDYEGTLKSVARLAVPRIADWVSVYLLPQGATRVKRLVATHVDPKKVAWADELAEKYPPDPDAPQGVYQVLRTGEPELHPDIPDQLLVRVAKDEEHLRILREVGLKAAMTVPLKARGRVFGAISFVAAESGRRYSEADLVMAQELADRAAHAVDNAGLYNEAQEAVRVRDDFLSVASHELKTPLTPLQLHVQSLERSARQEGGGDLPPRAVAKLDSISRQVARLEKLVNSLLDISRITGKRLDLEVEQVDLTSLIREVTERFREELRQVGSRLVLNLPAVLVGTWDRLRLDQILSNLVSNAIKFGAGKHIEITIEAVDGHARIEVRDYGIGIAPEDQARIFERFERAVPTRHYGGFGLGLWITRQIVEALGGTIGVQSMVGEGTTFRIELPLTAPEHREDPVPRTH